LRCGDQITRQPLASYVVQVACNVKRGKRFGPLGVGLGEHTNGTGQAKDEDAENELDNLPHGPSINAIIGMSECHNSGRIGRNPEAIFEPT
jgi:hypothetical protein